jgi:hypothetical protein
MPVVMLFIMQNILSLVKERNAVQLLSYNIRVNLKRGGRKID